MTVSTALRRGAPKSAVAADQTEDAATLLVPATDSPGEARLVVADGSSGTAASGWWARQLVDGLCTAPGRAFHDDRAFAVVAADAASRWPGHRQTLLTGTASSGHRTWLAQHRIRLSPAATILGIRLLPDTVDDRRLGTARPGAGTWQAVSVGDSCLFQVRSDRQVNAVSRRTRVPPVVRAAADASPAVPTWHAGGWHDRDVFYLMTDALGRWWTRRQEEGGRPWEWLDSVCLAPPEDFAEWVRTQRSRRVLEDDDITLLRAECGPC